MSINATAIELSVANLGNVAIIGIFTIGGASVAATAGGIITRQPQIIALFALIGGVVGLLIGLAVSATIK